MSSSLAKVLEHERKQYKEFVRKAAAERDKILCEEVEAAIKEAVCKLGHQVVSSQIDFAGTCHKNLSGVVFELAFDNKCSISYKYCESTRRAMLYLTGYFNNRLFTLTPEDTSRIKNLRELFDDEEANGFSTIEDRMRAKAWRKCADCYDVLDVLEFAKIICDLYLKLVSRLHPQRKVIPIDCFLPNIFVTKMVELNVCVLPDVEVEVPPLPRDFVRTEQGVDFHAGEIHKDHDETNDSMKFAFPDEPSAEKIKAAQVISARVDYLTSEKNSLLEQKDKFEDSDLAAMDAYRQHMANIEKELADLTRILAFTQGYPIDISNVSVKIMQDDDWLANINDAVTNTVPQEDFSRWKEKVTSSATTSPTAAAAPSSKPQQPKKKKKSAPTATAGTTSSHQPQVSSSGSSAKTEREQMLRNDASQQRSADFDISNRLQRIRSIQNQLTQRTRDPDMCKRLGITQEMFKKETQKLEAEMDTLSKEIQMIKAQTKAANAAQLKAEAELQARAQAEVQAQLQQQQLAQLLAYAQAQQAQQAQMQQMYGQIPNQAQAQQMYGQAVPPRTTMGMM